MRILLADDDRSLLLSMRYLLESVGIESDGHEDGHGALAHFLAARAGTGAAPFDGVVTDLAMPGMRGSELARRIRAIDPDVPIVVMSGGFQEHCLDAVPPEGSIQLLEKPFELEGILAALERAGCPRRSPPGAGRPASPLLPAILAEARTGPSRS